MNRAIAWFAENHVAANLLMALLVLGGLFTVPGIRQEIFPEIDLPVVTIGIAYPGAAPREVEEAICVRVEEELQGLQGIKWVRSTASEGHGSVAVELLAGEDVRRRVDEIRMRVDGITTFPEDAEPPVIRQAEVRFQVLDVAISGDVDEWTLKRLGEQARDEILALPGITDVELVAARPYEISIEVSEEALWRYGIAFDDVARAVQRSSLDLPGGSLKTTAGEILLRTKSQAYDGTDFESLVLLSRPDGTRLTLGEVANVVDGFEETERVARFDGEPAVLLQVYRVGEQSALEISRSIAEYVAEAGQRLPAGVSYTVAQDDARMLRERLDTLLRNARGGFVLVLLVLALFLRLRLALWVTLGIPISFLGALWLLPPLGVSINLISLMAFIVVLGIVVDDAIIVGENTHTEQARGKGPLQGAIAGAQGIATPVIFGVLTTVAAFAPMLWIPGPMGRIARVVPLVVCVCLLFSLVESLFVLPAHLGHHGALEQAPGTLVSAAWRRFQDRVADRLRRFTLESYRPTLERALEWRYLTAALGTTAMLLTLGVLGGGWLKLVFQPDIEGHVTVAYVTMPQGTPHEVTTAAVDQLAAAAEAVARDVEAEELVDDGRPVFAHVLTTVGQQPYRIKQATGPSAFANAMATGSHLGEVQLEVTPAKRRRVNVEELETRWREQTGQIVGAEELAFSSTLMSAGASLHLEISGPSLERLRGAAELLERRVALYPGVVDISDSFRSGRQELELEILPQAEALGLSARDLGRQVRQAFYGQEIQRVQRGRDDVRVMVRFPAQDRRSLGDLERMHIRTADGSAVPFSLVARGTLGEGFAKVQRVDQRRVVTVTAEIDSQTGNANEILADLRREALPELLALYPDVRVSFEGEQREQREFLASLGRGWLLALFVIFALLAVPLRSYTQPLIVMTAIPFGLIGAVWGHLIMGHDFSMFSLVGVVALSGVVVNDSLVLVDYVNRCRRAGADLREALVAAGTARFRAILLTSLTTFAGLTPLLLEKSVQAQMLIPMGISLGFGVIFATLITLLLVPASYLILEDVVALARRRGRSREALGAAGLPDVGAIR
ncbi:MAG: efflux RND transporter permease subunit [Myxococcota bacterium]